MTSEVMTVEMEGTTDMTKDKLVDLLVVTAHDEK